MEKGLKLPLMPKKEEAKLSLIPMKEAVILWNRMKLKVLFCNKEEWKNFDPLPLDATDGTCFFDWNLLTIPNVMSECLRIFIEEPKLDKKNTLLEFSKIKELEELRRMTFVSFFYDEYRGDYFAYLIKKFGA